MTYGSSPASSPAEERSIADVRPALVRRRLKNFRKTDVQDFMATWRRSLTNHGQTGEGRHDDLGRVVVLFSRTFPATRADDADLTFP